MNGFEVILTANKSFLVPVDVDLSGTVLPGTPTVIVECIRGLLIRGSVCSPADNTTTLHLVATASPGQSTTPPTTGLLFIAIYNIVGTVTSGIPVTYASGCSTSSVGNGVCVTVAGGSTSQNSETAQNGSFDNSAAAAMASVTLTTSNAIFGPEFPGTTNTTTITATAMNAYPSFFSSDSVDFTATMPSGSTATLSGTNPCTTSGISCSVSLTVGATAPGNYAITVSGTYPTADLSGNPDTLVSTVTILLDVTDFGFSVNPTTVYFVLGSSGSTTATLSSLNGFTGSITLSAGTVVPATPPLTISFNPGSVTLSGGQIVTSNVTFSGPATTGTYHVPIKATSGTRTKTSASLVINVINGHSTTESISCLPTTVVVGYSASCTATVTDPNSSPTSPTGSVYFTSNGQGTFQPTSCSLSGSSSTANCSASYAPSHEGSHTITASYGGDTGHGSSQATTAPLTVVDPTATKVSCSPDSVLQTKPTTCSVTVTDNAASPVTPTGTVTFTTNSTGTFTPSSGICTLSPGIAVDNATCSVTYTPTVHALHLITGIYVADSAHQTSSDVFGLVATLAPAKVSLQCSPSTLTADGSSTRCTATILDSSSNPATPTGTVSFVTNTTGTFSPSSATCALSPGNTVNNATCSITYVPGVGGNQTITGNYGGDSTHGAGSNETLLIVAGFKIIASPPTVVIVVGVLGNSTITAQALNGFTGTVSLAAIAQSGLTCGPLSPSSIVLGTSQSTTLSCSSTNALDYSVTVSGASGSVSYAKDVTFSIGDFQLTTSNHSPVVAEGTSGSVTVTVTSLNGFSGTVNLMLTNKTTAPPGYPQPTFTLTPTSVTLSPNGVRTVTIGIFVGPRVYPTTYQILVNGTSGFLKNPAPQIVLTVPRPDFSISHSPATAVIIVLGQTGTANINVTATNGYNGSVTFSYSASPSGLTCSFGRSSVILLPGGLNTTTISCSGSSQVYAVTVTGTAVETYDQGITHVTIPVYSVIDFTLQPTPSGITVNVGQTAHAQINVTWTSGYSGIVTFKTFPSNSAVTAPNPASLTGSGVVTLDVSSTASGTFTVVVNATSNTVTHSTTITVTVLAPANSSILGLDPTVFYSIVGAVIVLVAVAAFLASRRAKSRSRKK